MSDRMMSICIPLPALSPKYALEFTEFLYELAGRIEANYYHTLQRYYQRQRESCDLANDDDYFGKDPVPGQLELFDDLELF